MNKSELESYYLVLDECAKTGRLDKLIELLANLLVEALRRRFAKLTVKKITPFADWVRVNGTYLQSVTNKAIRGTIPAFRVRGHWMIDSGYN